MSLTAVVAVVVAAAAVDDEDGVQWRWQRSIVTAVGSNELFISCHVLGSVDVMLRFIHAIGSLKLAVLVPVHACIQQIILVFVCGTYVPTLAYLWYLVNSKVRYIGDIVESGRSLNRYAIHLCTKMKNYGTRGLDHEDAEEHSV